MSKNGVTISKQLSASNSAIQLIALAERIAAARDLLSRASDTESRQLRGELESVASEANRLSDRNEFRLQYFGARVGASLQTVRWATWRATYDYVQGDLAEARSRLDEAFRTLVTSIRDDQAR